MQSKGKTARQVKIEIFDSGRVEHTVNIHEDDRVDTGLGIASLRRGIVIMLPVHLTAAHGWPMLRLIALPNFNISLDIRSALVMGDVGAGAINFEPRATQKSSDPNFSAWVAH